MIFTGFWIGTLLRRRARLWEWFAVLAIWSVYLALLKSGGSDLISWR